VRQVAVDVGDTVRAGQLLAEMDPVDLDERITALEASIARAGSGVVAAQAQRQDALAKKELAAINTRRYVELGGRTSSAPARWKRVCRNRHRPKPAWLPR
jgi:HlyD family secretion protein